MTYRFAPGPFSTRLERQIMERLTEDGPWDYSALRRQFIVQREPFECVIRRLERAGKITWVKGRVALALPHGLVTQEQLTEFAAFTRPFSHGHD